MNEMQNRIWAEIDLDAIKNNMQIIRSRTNKNAKVMAIVKADAYGHGVVQVAKTMLEGGADCFGVACVDEAMQLRQSGFDVPLLVLGAFFQSEISQVINYDITTTVFDINSAKMLSDAALKLNKKAKVHIKLDTGMHRIGLVTNRDDIIQKIKEICLLPGVDVTGLFSHFSCADTEKEDITKKQLDEFLRIVKELENEGIDIPIKHIANSAAIFRYPEAHLDMVRAGIVCYGNYPSNLIEPCGLIPAMSFKTTVTRVEKLYPGDSVSYGATFTAEKEMVCATLAVGYADGYSRLLSNKAEVLIDGEKVKICGKICMDQCMVDVTNVNNIAVGDVATLFGKDGVEYISVEDLADIMGTINYEILCMVSKRVPRVYLKDGKYALELNYITQLSKQ